MNALDTYIPTPQREEDKPFLMSIEDVFSIKGRGTVATGRIERGKVKVGDEVEIVGLMKAADEDGRHRRRNVQQDAGVRHGRRQRRRAAPRHRAHRPRARPGAGQAGGSITPHTKFEASVYVLTQGRRRPAHAVLHRLPAAVLLPHHRRDRQSPTLPDGARPKCACPATTSR